MPDLFASRPRPAGVRCDACEGVLARGEWDGRLISHTSIQDGTIVHDHDSGQWGGIARVFHTQGHNGKGHLSGHTPGPTEDVHYFARIALQEYQP